MSLLRDTAWRLKYTPDDGDLVRLFYVPALRSATRYDRLTGYFSSRALALAARGIEGLVLNNGKMRLIVGCTLGEEDVEAIERGEALRDAVERTIQRMPPLTGDPRTVDALELVAWMVAQGYLDVKLAVPCDANRRPIRDDSIFHEKTGIIEDKTGDRLAFNGSINETEYGWTRNWESFNAFTSWNDGPRVDEEEASFAKLWANQAKRAITLDVPTALREQLLTFLPDPEQLPKRMHEHEEAREDNEVRRAAPHLGKASCQHLASHLFSRSMRNARLFGSGSRMQRTIQLAATAWGGDICGCTLAASGSGLSPALRPLAAKASDC